MCFPCVYSFLSFLSIPEKNIHLLILGEESSNPITSAVKENETSKQMDSSIAVSQGTGILPLIIRSFIMARHLTLNHHVWQLISDVFQYNYLFFFIIIWRSSVQNHDVSKILFSISFSCNDFALNPTKLLFFQSTAMHSTT